MHKEVFKLHDKRFVVNGDALREAREDLGLTLAQFAVMCEWSTAYQWKLENGTANSSVSEMTKIRVENALAEARKPNG